MNVNAAWMLMRRDLLLAVRRPGEAATGLMFFVVVTSLFPLAIGPEGSVLQRIGPGVIWVSALLSTLLGLPTLFAHDHDDGSLEQLLLLPASLPLLLMGKMAAHWVIHGLPLVIVAPILAIQFGIDADSIGILVIALLLGSLVLTLLGTLGAALTLGVRGAGVVLPLLLLPLDVPPLIFGAGAVDSRLSGLDPMPHLLLLGALLLFALPTVPYLSALAVRIALE